MKKIVLTTEQLDKVTEYVKNEGQPSEMNEAIDDNRYEMNCKIDFNYGGLKFKGNEIEDISKPEIRVTYLIDVEHRSWGITSISLYDIQGPEEIELEIDYYPEGDEMSDYVTETITVKLPWDGIDTDKDDSASFIGLDEDIEIDLENDSEGNIVVTGMSVVEYSI